MRVSIEPPAQRQIEEKKTPYHVFYAVDEDARVLHVLAVWSSMRGEDPPV
jgi:hypothetical protein